MFDLVAFIKAVGYLGVLGVVFAESGLLLGFFLPGDSLLFTAGFLTAQGFLNIWILAGSVFIGAVLGDNIGYAFGYRIGPKIFKREDSIFFHKSNLEKARIFYESHGPKTIVLARFMPGVRTFAPILAGVGKMNYQTFFYYNMLGGVLWGMGLPWLGYFLGNAIPDIDKYLLPIIILIIAFSISPTIIHILRMPGDRRQILKIIKNKTRG